MRAILVVYGLMQYPLRSTVEDHLYSFRRYSSARVFYANALVGPVPGWMRRIPFDAIVFHTSFLSSLRWGPQVDETLRSRVLELDHLPGVRAAMPQDEFLRSGALCQFIRDARIDVVFSVSPASEWPKLYAGVDRERVRFEPTLTGYLDERTVRRIDEIVRETPDRPTDVFYRAGAERPYLGRHGLLKTGIATAGESAAAERGLTTDISLDPGATLLGDDWFRALARSRWTLGVEGGASILDHEGAIRDATMRYVAEHPDAGYDEIEAACFPGRDGELALFAISPRHLEACATRTGQILVEGSYSGVLEPGRHFLEVKADLSNLGDVLAEAGDESRRQALTDAAYQDIVTTGRHTYRDFIERFDAVMLAGSAASRSPLTFATFSAARAYDRLSWLRVARRLRPARWRAALTLQRPPAAADRTTVVSVTPMRLDSDSRTLKEAASLARMGLRSVVLEGARSTAGWEELPIEVVSLGAAPQGPAAAALAAPARRSLRTRIGRLLAPLVGPVASLVAINRATLAALPPAGLYWVHGVPQLPAVAWRAKRLGVPFVYDAHDFYADAANNNPDLTPYARRTLRIQRIAERLCVPLAAERVTVGAGVRELQEGRFSRPFTVLHNAHDHRLDRPAVTGIREVLGVGDNAFLVVAAGNSKAGTALGPAFDALAALPRHVHLAFVGRDYDEAEALAAAHGVDDRVSFLPPVAPSEVKGFIASADAAAILYFPLTSNFVNALPNRLYQAVAAGLPLLYPETMRAIRALCEQHDIGVPMDTRDARSVESAIRRLLDDPRERERLRGNARRAAQQVSWEQEEQELERLVSGLVTGCHTRTA